MEKILRFLEKYIIPRRLYKIGQPIYHFLFAYAATVFYGFPANKMIVIGVVGTRGKTTTANFIWSIFNAAGYKTGLIGTANIRIGNRETLNPYHMTMPGRFILQKLLSNMKKSGCRVVVVETPSEGVEQQRHRGINYDIAILTSLYPEYLEVHNWDYERCKQMNFEIFKKLNNKKRKIISNKKIPKIIIVNNDIQDKDLFLECKSDMTTTYAINSKADFMAKNIKASDSGVEFFVDNNFYKLNMSGEFNVYNALAALSAMSAFGINENFIKIGLEQLENVPGRMERINKGQNFSAIVDYAHDAVSIEALLSSAQKMKKEPQNKIIILLGAEGGGRDKKKRPVMGELAAKMADYVIISNVDPYNDNPKEIISDIVAASEKFGKIVGENLFAIEDRREGIKKAISLAKKGDIVLITGKGAEQSMIIGSQKIPWDDRITVKEILKNGKI